MDEHKYLIKQFMELYQLEYDKAEIFLRNNNWSIQAAIKRITEYNALMEMRNNFIQMNGEETIPQSIMSWSMADGDNRDNQPGMYFHGDMKTTEGDVSNMSRTISDFGPVIKPINVGDVDMVKRNGTDKTEKLMVINLWNEGYCIGDGKMNLYNEPKNQEFLMSILDGKIPEELCNQNVNINLKLQDQRDDCIKQMDFANSTNLGFGFVLKSSYINDNFNEDNIEKYLKFPNGSRCRPINVDEALTKIQIRLINGTPIVGEFNVNSTIADIYRYVQENCPAYEKGDFILMTSFPTYKLLDTGLTIEEACLQKSALLVRLQ